MTSSGDDTADDTKDSDRGRRERNSWITMTEISGKISWTLTISVEIEDGEIAERGHPSCHYHGVYD